MDVALSLNSGIQDLFPRECQKERCDDLLSKDSKALREWNSLGVTVVWVDSGWVPQRTKVKPQDCLVLAGNSEFSGLKICPNQFVSLLLAKFSGHTVSVLRSKHLSLFLSKLLKRCIYLGNNNSHNF